MATTFLTQTGYDKLLKELEELKNKTLPAILEKLKEAIEQGDISENAEYETAISEKELVEARIKKIEKILENVKIIEKQHGGEIRYGSHVVLEDQKGKQYEFTIVGTDETDILHGTISFKSPIGSALQGKKKGDIITVNAPQKKYQMTIVDVR